MTVSSTTTKASYSGNGSTTVFAVPFYFLQNADLLVILRSSAGVETTQVLGTNYTLTGAGNENGGSLTMTVAPPTGTTLTILRNAAATQETDLLPNDRLPAESLETALDKLTMLVQQLDEENDRALKFAQTDSTASTTLPTAPNRANKFLSFDNNGNPIFVGATDIYTVGVETKVATQGQTVFTLSTISYTPGINNLSVFVDGVNQVNGSAYTETNSTTVTFSQGLHAGAIVKFSTARNLASGSADSASVTFLPAGSGAVQTSVQTKLRETVSVKDFGAVGDGVTNDTAAIAAAHATGKLVFYPYGTYKHVGYFPACEGGIIGEGHSPNVGAKKTQIVFYNCTSTTTGAITPKSTSPKSNYFTIENIEILASSWDATTGCLGYGLDIGVPVRITNVSIANFKKSNIFLHHIWPVSGSYVDGPYESVFVNVVSTRSGQHGCLVGAGANVLNFINYQGKWNGAPSFGVNPTVAGLYDGFVVSNTADGNDITLYVPESISISSGDCSYNSRYGWNFDSMGNSAGVFPGYAEGNLVKQGRFGDISNARIDFAQVAGERDGILNSAVYTPYFFGSSVYLGGKQIHPADYYSFVSNPALNDQSSGAVQNAPTRTIYLSRSNDSQQVVYFSANQTPDGTSVNKNTETVTTLRGFGTYALGIGSSGRHLKVSDNFVRLPDFYYQATGTGWSASSLLRGIGTAAPSSGSWNRGDIVYNSEPSSAGYIGWVCTASGSPGTWKGFGVIA